MRKFILRLFSIIPAVALQVLFYMAIFKWLSAYSGLLSLVTTVLSACMVLYILNVRMESSYKTFWLVVIFVFPVAGTWIYFLCGYNNAAKSMEKKALKTDRMKIETTKPEIMDQLTFENPRMAQSLKMLAEESGFPIVRQAAVKYYPLIDEAFEEMLQELENASKFVFLEFFIIESGKMLDGIVEVLKRKVQQGVKVYILYDDIGSLFTYSFNELKKLNYQGIVCRPFNPILTIKPILNNRDHRKIMVIDNRVVFTGGFNLADEYINAYEKHGHWKDIAVRMDGEIVHSYSKMFVDMWNITSKEKIDESLIDPPIVKESQKGYCLAYYDSPARDNSISNTLLIDLLYQAKKRAWFYTPYLILNDSLLEALVQSALRGVDVRIITPGVPDKKIVYSITQSNYSQLLKNGVKIFEYTPGFVHAKACIFDDQIATIGTVNLDYRSLFLHYECNCLYYDGKIIKELEKDYLQTQSKCHQVVLDGHQSLKKRIFGAILKLISPLC